MYTDGGVFYTPDENNAQSIDHVTDRGNSIGGWIYRLSDSDDFKEWQLHITTPPKACTPQFGCTDATDECNGQ